MNLTTILRTKKKSQISLHISIIRLLEKKIEVDYADDKED